MGTPAFPNLGKHCSVDDCHQIDFLPFTCDCCNQVVIVLVAVVLLGLPTIACSGLLVSLIIVGTILSIVIANVFCLEHRSYGRHQCPKANKHDVTVVICPLCAKGVRLIHNEDPNITWESHVNIECDPSNYESTTKKRKCPVPGCREILTFSNSIKCRDCTLDHCLKHRFGPDHKCPGPKKPESSFQFMGFLNRSQKQDPKRASVASSSNWGTSFLKAASSVRATAEAGITRLSNEFNQALSKDGAVQSNNGSTSQRGSVSGQVEVCPRCNLRFPNVGALVDHVEKVHERNGVMKATLDVCPKCSKGFRDPVTLVEHVEREHGGVSKS